jgi:hypothetical protein
VILSIVHIREIIVKVLLVLRLGLGRGDVGGKIVILSVNCG